MASTAASTMKMWSIFNGKQVDDWRVDSLHEFFSQHKSIPNWEGVRNERYVYARYVEQNPPYEFLHDLKADPDQRRNFAKSPEYAEILGKLRSRCDDLIKTHGGKFQ